MNNTLSILNKRLESLVAYMLATGTEQTTTGNYIFSFDELQEPFEFVCEHEEIIADMLAANEKVLDIDTSDHQFDIIFGLDWCPNYSQDNE